MSDRKLRIDALVWFVMFNFQGKLHIFGKLQINIQGRIACEGSSTSLVDRK